MTYVTMTVGKGNIERETAKAILYGSNDGSVWLPKSQISLELPEEPHLPGEMTMPYWLAKEKFSGAGVQAMLRTGNSWLEEA